MVPLNPPRSFKSSFPSFKVPKGRRKKKLIDFHLENMIQIHRTKECSIVHNGSKSAPRMGFATVPSILAGTICGGDLRDRHRCPEFESGVEQGLGNAFQPLAKFEIFECSFGRFFGFYISPCLAVVFVVSTSTLHFPGAHDPCILIFQRCV